MNLRLQVEVVKCRIGKLLGGKCFVCGCEKSRGGMTVHHLWYIFNDVVYKNYLPRNDTNTLRYYNDLEPLVKENKKRFMYLCNKCHHALEKFNQFGEEKFNRLIKARQMTKTRRNI